METSAQLIKENEKRISKKHEHFDPISGEQSLGKRTKVSIEGCPLGAVQYLPTELAKHPLIVQLKSKGWAGYSSEIGSEELLAKVYCKLRSKYDFPFWAAMFVYIKNKAGGEDVTLRLNRGQRILINALEEQRLADKPMRVILLKARQFGGSTATEAYICWLQTVQTTSMNSVIATHANSVSATIRGMMTKMLDALPYWMLYPIGKQPQKDEPKTTSFEGQQGIQYVPSRRCKIRIATASNPEAMRSEDVSFAHCSEVALWQETKIIHAEDYVDAVLSGILPKANTLKVLESTAKGLANYFAKEWQDAKKGIGEYTPVFVGWKDIENDEIPFASVEEKATFAKWLLDHKGEKEAPDRRSESGSYLWRQWEEGATLEGLHWYVHERKSKSSHDHMASEAPSNDREAFSSTGEPLFDEDHIELMRKACKAPKWIGEVQGKGTKGKDCLKGVKFIEDKSGELAVWCEPEVWEDARVRDRYCVTVDIGGLAHGADWSVIMVLDRYWMMEGGKPQVVAQWYGHIDHDLLAWKAAQIATWYQDALLIVESNTLDKERDVNADVSEFILNRVKSVYNNLYERERSEEEIANNLPVKYGFHTNRATKPKIIKQLQEAVRDQLYVERDERCLDEMLTYEHNGQKYEAKQGLHDDLLMTRAIGLWVALNEMPIPQEVPWKVIGSADSDTQNMLL